MIRGTRKLNRGPSKAVKNYVNQKIQRSMETKINISTLDAVGIQDNGRTPINSAITDISQGTDQQQRIGNQIHVTGYYANFSIAASMTDDYNTVRLVFYSPKDPSNTLSAVGYEDVIDLDQFNVYYDRLHAVSSNGGPHVKTVTVRKKFNKGNKQGKKVQYSGTGASTYAHGPLFFYCVSDSLAVSDPTLSGRCILYFKDA